MSEYFGLNSLLWSLFAGIVIGAFYAYYNKKIIGGFVRTLIGKKAFSTESALRLDEVGFAKNGPVKSALNHGGSLAYTVESTEERRKSRGRAFFDFKSARFYIPQDRTIKALTLYKSKGISVFTLLLTIAIFFALVWLGLEHADDIAGIFNSMMNF